MSPSTSIHGMRSTRAAFIPAASGSADGPGEVMIGQLRRESTIDMMV